MSLAERFILLETWTTVEHLVLIGVRVILARAPFSCASFISAATSYRAACRLAPSASRCGNACYVFAGKRMVATNSCESRSKIPTKGGGGAGVLCAH